MANGYEAAGLSFKLPQTVGDSEGMSQAPSQGSEFKPFEPEKDLATGFAYDAGNDRFYFSQAGITNSRFTVSVSISLASSVGNTETTLRLHVNGAAVEGVFINRKIGTGGDVGAFPLSGALSLTENDYVEVYIECNNTTTITISAFNFRLVEVN